MLRTAMNCIALLIVLTSTDRALCEDAAAAVRMGSGIMTFDTVPGWGLREDGNSAIGPTHGGVAVDKEGNVYTSANQGVFVFTPEVQVVQKPPSLLNGQWMRWPMIWAWTQQKFAARTLLRQMPFHTQHLWVRSMTAVSMTKP